MSVASVHARKDVSIHIALQEQANDGVHFALWHIGIETDSDAILLFASAGVHSELLSSMHQFNAASPQLGSLILGLCYICSWSRNTTSAILAANFT